MRSLVGTRGQKFTSRPVNDCSTFPFVRVRQGVTALQLKTILMDTPVACSNLQVIREIVTDVDALAAFDPYDVGAIQTPIRTLWRHGKIAHPPEGCSQGCAEQDVDRCCQRVSVDGS